MEFFSNDVMDGMTHTHTHTPEWPMTTEYQPQVVPINTLIHQQELDIFAPSLPPSQPQLDMILPTSQYTILV